MDNKQAEETDYSEPEPKSHERKPKRAQFSAQTAHQTDVTVTNDEAGLFTPWSIFTRIFGGKRFEQSAKEKEIS